MSLALCILGAFGLLISVLLTLLLPLFYMLVIMHDMGKIKRLDRIIDEELSKN